MNVDDNALDRILDQAASAMAEELARAVDVEHALAEWERSEPLAAR